MEDQKKKLQKVPVGACGSLRSTSLGGQVGGHKNLTKIIRPQAFNKKNVVKYIKYHAVRMRR